MKGIRQAQPETQPYRQGQQERIQADEQKPPEDWRQIQQLSAREEQLH